MAKYTDEELEEFLKGHRLCGWISEDRTGCDCGHYDRLKEKDPEIAPQLVAYRLRNIPGHRGRRSPWLDT